MASFQSFGLNYVELIYQPRMVRAGNVHRHFSMDVHPEALAALKSGRGGVFVTLHLGNWEITGSLSPFFGLPLVSVARPIENPLLNDYLFGMREKTGQRIVRKRGALRELGRALRNGEFLGILADQNAGRHGIFVEYFGRPASTVGAPATIALKYGAPMIPACQVRKGGNLRHHCTVDRPIEPPETGDRAKDVWLMTQEMTRRFEAWVRQDPEQWLWAHRRWKTRPKDGEEWRLSPSTSTE